MTLNELIVVCLPGCRKLLVLFLRFTQLRATLVFIFIMSTAGQTHVYHSSPITSVYAFTATDKTIEEDVPRLRGWDVQ